MEVTITEKLQKKYAKAQRALASLKIALERMDRFKNSGVTEVFDYEETYRMMRDSMVQRFEYTFDLTWKYLGMSLDAAGIAIESRAPKAVFREALKAKYLSEEQARRAIEMVNDRNVTTHGYDEEVVESVCRNIPDYYILLAAIFDKTTSQNALLEKY